MARIYRNRSSPLIIGLCAAILWTFSAACGEPALIFHHGTIVTVDDANSVQQAIAIQDGRVLKVGDNESIQKLAGPTTQSIDLGGKMLLPGLIDSHSHATWACMTEYDHPIPDMESIADVLNFIKARAQEVKEGSWIKVDQVFITRLREMRYPSRAELDEAAPKHPVAFRTGPDASLNTMAMKLSGIDKDFVVKDGGSGFVEKDAATGEPTGILRNLMRFVKTDETSKPASSAEHVRRLAELLGDYNSVGITGICDRDASYDAIEYYKKLRDAGTLTTRVAISYDVKNFGPIDDILDSIKRIGDDPLFKQKDPMLHIIGIKTYLDGGMLTGSAYMQKPWGVSKLYGIVDPAYRGVLNIPHDRLLKMVRTTADCGLQFTAHSVGDGAVQALLDVYEELSKEHPIRAVRSSITHSNFMSKEAVAQAARLGVVLDIQPIWLYLDTRALLNQFGYDRLRYFQPLKSIFEAGGIAGGGSDHMQKIGSFRAINPYNPFLGMQTAVTRKAKWQDAPLHPEEALTREQAIRFYTKNNAVILFCDDKTGSLEAGKSADFIIVDTDLLTCPAEAISKTQVLETYLDGKRVFKRN